MYHFVLCTFVRRRNCVPSTLDLSPGLHCNLSCLILRYDERNLSCLSNKPEYYQNSSLSSPGHTSRISCRAVYSPHNQTHARPTRMKSNLYKFIFIIKRFYYLLHKQDRFMYMLYSATVITLSTSLSQWIINVEPNCWACYKWSRDSNQPRKVNQQGNDTVKTSHLIILLWRVSCMRIFLTLFIKPMASVVS